MRGPNSGDLSRYEVGMISEERTGVRCSVVSVSKGRRHLSF